MVSVTYKTNINKRYPSTLSRKYENSMFNIGCFAIKVLMSTSTSDKAAEQQQTNAIETTTRCSVFRLDGFS